MKVEELSLKKPILPHQSKQSVLAGKSTADLLGLSRIERQIRCQEKPDRIGYPVRHEKNLGQTFDGGQVVLVQDEESGEVSYMVRSKDGHLGSLGGE